MSENDNSSRWMAFAERVGGPTIIVLAMLFGAHQIGTPAADALVRYIEQQSDNMEEQTIILRAMAEDVKDTRLMVVKDAGERKAELLHEITRRLMDLNTRIYQCERSDEQPP